MKVVNTNEEVKIILSYDELDHIANGMNILNPSELLNSKVSDLVKHLASELKRFSGIDLFENIPENYSVGVMTMEDHVTLEISKANDMTDMVVGMIDSMQDKPGRFKPVFTAQPANSTDEESGQEAGTEKVARNCFYVLRSIGEAVSLSSCVKQGSIVKFKGKIGILTSDLVPALEEYSVEKIKGLLIGEEVGRIVNGRLRRK